MLINIAKAFDSYSFSLGVQKHVHLQLINSVYIFFLSKSLTFINGRIETVLKSGTLSDIMKVQWECTEGDMRSKFLCKIPSYCNFCDKSPPSNNNSPLPLNLIDQGSETEAYVIQIYRYNAQ